LLALNDLEPDGVSIVDTFGSLLPSDLTTYLSLFTDNLNEKIKLGLHLHENLSLSFALAIQFIRESGPSRDIIIDSSLLGMGRAPGNLPTELIIPFLNKENDKNYDLQFILKTIDEEINPLKKTFKWGYSPEYALTAFNRIHRSYAEYLTEELSVPLEHVSQVTKHVIAEHLENSFDAQFTKHILEKLNG
jgi:4-hydroxy 2-oxovalerate aldolase